MRAYVGTSGYSYPQWKGSFYPPKTPASHFLRTYAERLPAVEINNTFYRMPKTSVLDAWASEVPEGFAFVLKASRRITHFARLDPSDEVLGFMLEGARRLGEKLGALLVQCPPNLPLDLPRLDAFAARMPADIPWAVEFRHPSWAADEGVARLLAARGVPLCDALDPAPGWGYLRLRQDAYSAAELARWARDIAAIGWQRTFVFFKHEVEGPTLACDLLRRLNETSP